MGADPISGEHRDDRVSNVVVTVMNGNGQCVASDIGRLSRDQSMAIGDELKDVAVATALARPPAGTLPPAISEPLFGWDAWEWRFFIVGFLVPFLWLVGVLKPLATHWTFGVWFLRRKNVIGWIANIFMLAVLVAVLAIAVSVTHSSSGSATTSGGSDVSYGYLSTAPSPTATPPTPPPPTPPAPVPDTPPVYVASPEWIPLGNGDYVNPNNDDFVGPDAPDPVSVFDAGSDGY